MTTIDAAWKRLFAFRRTPPIDRYHVRVVTAPAELAYAEDLPLAIRYVLAVRPSRFEIFRQLLERGWGIGVRTVDKTPERVLLAVDRIARGSQHNTVLPWLERLLRLEEVPVFSEADLQTATAQGIDLAEEVRIILSERHEFKKIVLVPLRNQCVTPHEQTLVDEINADLYPHAIEVIVNRVTFDNAHTRTEVAQSIIKALLIIGPIAHVLEHVLSGLGKVFAASADDLLSEVAELFALRGSGFTWNQLIRRSRILIVVFLIATYGAFQVHPLLEARHPGWAGVVFGLSAVALSLTTALQSIRLYLRSFDRLVHEGKLRLSSGQTLWGLALRQDFTNPARLGLFAGAVVSPFIAATVFILAPASASNGWVLALLGSVESVVAGLTVHAARQIDRALFRARVRKAFHSAVRV